MTATATKAKPNSDTIYSVDFHGEYYIDAPGRKGIRKTYRFKDIRMTDHERQMGFLHVFVRQVLTDPDFINNVAKVKYPDWVRHRTHHEDGVYLVQPDQSRIPITEFGLMNRKQLVGFIEQKKLKIEYDLYPTAAELKQVIKDYRDNQKAFLEFQAKRKEVHGDKLQAAKTVRMLNNWAMVQVAQDEGDPLKPEHCIPKDLAEEDEVNEFFNAMDEV